MADPSFAKNLSRELRAMNDTLNSLEDDLRQMAEHFEGRLSERQAIKQRLDQVIEEVENLAVTDQVDSNTADNKSEKDAA